jgi:hypothetical protein
VDDGQRQQYWVTKESPHAPRFQTRSSRALPCQGVQPHVGDRCDRVIALASTIVDWNPEYQKAESTVAAYHESCLRELIEHVANAIDTYRAGDSDAFKVEGIIHQYHQAATELWKFCWAGSGSHIRTAAHVIEHNAESGQVIDWWARGAPRRR